MMDKLEEYLKGHRDSLDTEPVPEFLSGYVAKKHKNSSRISLWISVAASVAIVIAGAAYLLSSDSDLSAEQDEMVKYSKADMKWEETANGYALLIHEKKAELSNLAVTGVGPAYFQVFLTELERLDSEEEKCKEKLSGQGYSPRVSRLLIEILLRKLRLMESLESEIKKINERSKRYNNEKHVDFLAV